MSDQEEKNEDERIAAEKIALSLHFERLQREGVAPTIKDIISLYELDISDLFELWEFQDQLFQMAQDKEAEKNRVIHEHLFGHLDGDHHD